MPGPIAAAAAIAVALDVLDAGVVVGADNMRKSRKLAKEQQVPNYTATINTDGSVDFLFENNRTVHLTSEEYEVWVDRMTKERKERLAKVGKAFLDTDLRDVGHGMRSSITTGKSWLSGLKEKASEKRAQREKDELATKLAELDENVINEVAAEAERIKAEKEAEEAKLEAEKAEKEAKKATKTAAKKTA